MKKNFLSILLISSVLLNSFIFIGCKENKKVEVNNKTEATENQDTNNKTELAKKIMKTQNLNDVTITPVKVTNPGKNFYYTKTSESNLYYCKKGNFNPNDLSHGFVIDFFGEAKDGSYQFKITSYDMLKKGGDGTVDSGTAYPNGQIVMNH